MATHRNFPCAINADFRPIVLTAANEDDVRVVAELIEVVQYPDRSGP